MTQQTMLWIDALLDGSINEEDFAQLQAILKSDPTALAYYCKQAEVDGRLHWELGDPKNQQSTVHVPTSRVANVVPLHRQPLLWAAAAAIVLLLGFVMKLGWVENSEPSDGIASSPATNDPPQIVSSESAPIARLTKVSDAKWQSTSSMEDNWLKPGSLHLLSGSAEISFDSGARIILQGPAKLRLVTAHKARLLQGKATTHIPSQAVGFELETPSTSFSDQDSSFAVAVADDGSTEVHVIRGLVEATPRANPKLARMLSNRQSLRLTNKVILANSKERHSIRTFTKELPSSPYARSSQYLHWSMNKPKNGQIAETGNHSAASFPASILARPGTSKHASADIIKGRFGNAVQLNGRGAFLSSGFPGISGSQARTVSFWVRIAPNTPKNQAYSMVAWGNPGAQKGGKWQIAWNTGTDNQGKAGAIRTEFGGGYVVGSTGLRDGRWHHIVVVYLGGKSVDVATHIRHYVDGRLETVTAAKSQTIDTWITSGQSLPTYIGRRLENDRPNTGFKGALDEVYIFPAALTPQQINALYRKNMPPKETVSTVNP